MTACKPQEECNVEDKLCKSLVQRIALSSTSKEWRHRQNTLDNQMKTIKLIIKKAKEDYRGLKQPGRLYPHGNFEREGWKMNMIKPRRHGKRENHTRKVQD